MKKQFRLNRSFTKALLVSLFSFSYLYSPAQANSPVAAASAAATGVKNIVIVHGAFADASGWQAVYQILKKDGYAVTLVQNPLTSLQDDVTATSRVLDKLDGPAVLVGHSWGGSVITEAGVSPKVASLVYVSAFAPDAGESTLGIAQTVPMMARSGILPPDENGLVYFNKSLFHELFAADLPQGQAGFMADSQQPIAGACFTAVLTQAAWKTKPSYAVLSTEDKAINPVLQRSMYKRAGAMVTEIKGSHVTFMSHPQQVAKVIEAAAAGRG